MPKNIHVIKRALPKDLCRRIVERYESDGEKVFEDGSDYALRHSVQVARRPEWEDLEGELSERIGKLVDDYLSSYPDAWAPVQEGKRRVLRLPRWRVSGLRVSRYDIGQSCAMHFDGPMKRPGHYLRLATVLFFLNDVKRGGETWFPSQRKLIKPRGGAAIVFPPTLHYPHASRAPKSSPRYIAHGWVTYQDLRIAKES